MDDRPVSEHRLEVIDSGSGERLYSAMRDQAERGREFRRRVRWMWLRRDLMEPTEESGDGATDAPVIDLRDGQPVSSTEVLPESRQQDSA
jgi:hypothetical protein